MMESYAPLLEKLRLPQPSLQKFAVISIFSKLRSASYHLDPDSGPGRDAISQCLHSPSAAVVDQSVREVCRLVSESKMDLSRGFLELQSALEGCDSKFVPLFVKGLGFLVRFGFRVKDGVWQISATENHPFVKVLSCRAEVQIELEHQVLLFMVQSKQLGMGEVCEFLRPFLNYSIMRVPFSDSSSSSFVRNLISVMASFCCSYPHEAMPMLKLLTRSVKYLPLKNGEDFRSFVYIMECLMDAYIVVVRHLVQKKSMISEAQRCGVELLKTTLSPYTCLKLSIRSEPIIELVKRILAVQEDLGLQYIPELSSIVLSLLLILVRSDLEHEQLSMVRFLLFLLKWKSKNDGGAVYTVGEELLLVFPVISLLSSPSGSLKEAAADLLLILEKLLLNYWIAPENVITKERAYPLISTPESIISRLLQHLWFEDQTALPTSLYLSFASASGTDKIRMFKAPKYWAFCLKEFCMHFVETRKCSLPLSQFQENFLNEMPLLLGAVATLLLLHRSFRIAAIDTLAVIGTVDPKLGVPLLLAVLFLSNVFTKVDVNNHGILTKLLGLIPQLASHSVMIPLIVQTILPMLHSDARPVLYATAIRLLCQTWESNDRVFGHLQGVLLPKALSKFASERNIYISLAASVRDVCKKNPDRGVDLILSVSECIESQDPLIQGLGFQSLSYLCEADVIDFYTAWDVITKHVVNYSNDPVLAKSMCFLLRWGAMDAEAYAEAASSVLKILWNILSSTQSRQGINWAEARVSALEALMNYDVTKIAENIPEFKVKLMELLFLETRRDVLAAMEGFLVKIITHEHINRRRSMKEKRARGSKIEKLLDVFPQVVFSAGKRSAGDLPGAVLLCPSFSPKDFNQGISRDAKDVHHRYENAAVEISASLQLSRNLLLGIISLQSWKSFMRRWMRANILSLDSKGPSSVLDKTSKAANDILKSLMQIAEESIPRSAENIALAIGALCMVLPPSAHTIISAASKFLLSWLFRYEHEHCQWTAAVSLGLVSSCLHVTDHKQKFQNIKGLLEVFCNCKSTFVRGACGTGLGYSCQDLLTRVEDTGGSVSYKGSYMMQETELLGQMLRVMTLTLCQFSQSCGGLESILVDLPLGRDEIDISKTVELLASGELEEDVWGVSGILFGLVNSVGALYRVGAHDAVVKLKHLILSWIPYMSSETQYSDSCNERPELVLSVGSCLALPVIVAFCQRVELVDNNELDLMVTGYKYLISDLVSAKKSGILHQSLLMASCVGAGGLLSCISNEGVYPLEVECVKGLMDTFKKCYSNQHPPIVHFSGMLGVVNAMGADAGFLFHSHPFKPSMQASYENKEASYIRGPLLSAPSCEPHLTSLVQEIYLVVQNSADHQLQRFAAWAISFLFHCLYSKENTKTDVQSEDAGFKPISLNISEGSMVMKLCLWLMNLNFSGTDATANVHTVVIVLRCLSKSPRLPTLDWGAIVRRCMRYGAEVARFSSDSAVKGTLREECILLSLAHARQYDPFLTFLDELLELPRFRTLELNLQLCLVLHLADLVKIFSGSRLERLLDDIANHLLSLPSSHSYKVEQKSLLRLSCWKGFCQCLGEASLDSLEYICNIEKCMEVLFSLLPPVKFAGIEGVDQETIEEEWSQAVICLGKARQKWVLDFLQILQDDFFQGDVQLREVLKKIYGRARLVRIGSLPMTELARLKAYILNCESVGIWEVLVEVAAAVQHADMSVKRHWLVDAVEISCVSRYPSTALQFVSLLSGSCCKYMPLLVLDRETVLTDLPITLSSLMSEPAWESVAESVTSYLWVSAERIHNWAMHVKRGDASPSIQPIDESENSMASLLAAVMHHLCVSLKDYLPLDKQLRLASMELQEV